MNRRAILIGYPGQVGAENYCAGVYVDLERYETHLKSAVGGFWYADEVAVLNSPTCDEVKMHLMAAKKNAEFIFIAFAGHACHSKTSDSSVLEINSTESIDSDDLLVDSTKQVLVLDACRQEAPFSAQRLFAEAAARVKLDKVSCRLYYDKLVRECPDNKVVTYACAKGETASDSARYGGIYNSSLLNSAESWALKQTEEGNLSIVEAHDNAADEVKKKTGNTQNPSIQKPKSGPYYPFAVVA